MILNWWCQQHPYKAPPDKRCQGVLVVCAVCAEIRGTQVQGLRRNTGGLGGFAAPERGGKMREEPNSLASARLNAEAWSETEAWPKISRHGHLKPSCTCQTRMKLFSGLGKPNSTGEGGCPRAWKRSTVFRFNARCQRQ